MVPFFSWMPWIVRRRFKRARIYTCRQIVRLIESGLRVERVCYLWPAVDQLGIGPLNSGWVRRLLRAAFSWLERSRLAWMGMSIFVVAAKPSNR